MKTNIRPILLILSVAVLFGGVFWGYKTVRRKRRKSLSEEAKEALNCIRDGHCKHWYEECGKDDTCIRTCRKPLRDSLQNRHDFPYVHEDKMNGHIRNLQNCYIANCSMNRVERLCSDMEIGTKRMREDHYLLNDERTTESAEECQERCLNHIPPNFPENCRSWTWIRRKHRDDYQMCYMYTSSIAAESWRKGVSGTCEGGVTKSEESLHEERTLCPQIRESPENLQVWLKVRRRLSIDIEKATQLLRFMNMTGMCTSDADFMDVFNEFKEQQVEESISIFAPLKAVYELIHDLWDLVNDNLAAITSVLSLLYGAIRYLFPGLHPYFDQLKDLVDKFIHKKKKEEQPDEQDSNPDDAKAEVNQEASSDTKVSTTEEMDKKTTEQSNVCRE